MNAKPFFDFSRNTPLLDIRSPLEFEEGHIPGAVSFPLFSNEERAKVGTCYKREGKDAAVKLGLKYVGPKLVSFVSKAEKLAPSKEIALYCWRGGMRSRSMEWLLGTAGFTVTRLEGGYKNFRAWMREEFTRDWNFICLGGMTGTGKTAILHELDQAGEQVLDLEGLAEHYGSAFGHIHSVGQPTTPQFNNLVVEKLQTFDISKPIWVEDESKHIGKVWLDDELYNGVKRAPLVLLETDLVSRVEWLCRVYGETDADHLIDAFAKIEKRLGPQHVKEACEAIRNANLAHAAEIALSYYDKSYRHLLTKREEPATTMQIAGLSRSETAQKLINEVVVYE